MAKTVKSAGAAAAQKSGKSIKNSNAPKSTKKSAVTTNAPKIDHLNVFEPFSNASGTHENVLTRSFLILLKYIPWLRNYFFKSLKDVNKAVSKNGKEIQIYTQVDDKKEIFQDLNGFTLFSIVISDDKYQNNNNKKVKECKRKAIYDGVIISKETKSVFIIEDKPSLVNVNFDQLCPSENTVAGNGIKVNEDLCALSWRKIIGKIKRKRNGLQKIEKLLIDDFIEFISMYRSELNPYDTFKECGNNLLLLNLRCHAILDEYAKKYCNNVQVEHQKAWQYYVPCDLDTLKKIPLNAEKRANEWAISTDLYLGNTTDTAANFYKIPNLKDKLAVLENAGYTIKPCLHLGDSWSRGLCYFDESDVSWLDYVDYWQKNKTWENRMYSKKSPNAYNNFIDVMIKAGFVKQNDKKMFNDATKSHSCLDVRPDLLVSYTWSKKDAEKLDKNGKFVEDFNKKVEAVKKILK